MPSYRPVITAVVVAALACLTSCKEEDTRLFDETGVWTLERYSLAGEPFQDIAQVRKSRFLLRFKPEDGVVAAAGCHEMGDDPDIRSSTCVNAGLSTWSCQCFAYTYDTTTMIWQEFPPGETPPMVGIPAGGESSGSEGGGDSDAHVIELASFGGSTTTFEFSPLPLDLFNSDGSSSTHVFQLKADSVWTEVDINMDETPDLEACSQSCFPSEG